MSANNKDQDKFVDSKNLDEKMKPHALGHKKNNETI